MFSNDVLWRFFAGCYNARQLWRNVCFSSERILPVSASWKHVSHVRNGELKAWKKS
jgi:hypothetical protein